MAKIKGTTKYTQVHVSSQTNTQGPLAGTYGTIQPNSAGAYEFDLKVGIYDFVLYHTSCNTKVFGVKVLQSDSTLTLEDLLGRI